MGWIIVCAWIGIGILTHIFLGVHEEIKYKKNLDKYDSTWAQKVAIGIPMAFGVGLLLWGLYYVWYFVCSGFLVFIDDLGVLERIGYFIISIILLVFLCTGVMVILGKR